MTVRCVWFVPAKKFSMPKLFESSAINGMEFANRVIGSATWEGICCVVGKKEKQKELERS